MTSANGVYVEKLGGSNKKSKTLESEKKNCRILGNSCEKSAGGSIEITKGKVASLSPRPLDTRRKSTLYP
jgi:hypothetical protein